VVHNLYTDARISAKQTVHYDSSVEVQEGMGNRNK